MRTRTITTTAALLLALTACNDGDSATQSNADKPSQAASSKAPDERRLPIVLRAILRLAGNDTIAVGTRLQPRPPRTAPRLRPHTLHGC